MGPVSRTTWSRNLFSCEADWSSAPSNCDATTCRRRTPMSAITLKDGTTIYYKDWGKGEAIVFSHGWPLSGDAFEDQMFFLASHGYRCIALEAPRQRLPVSKSDAYHSQLSTTRHR